MEEYIQKTNPVVRILLKYYELTDQWTEIPCLICAQAEKDTEIIIEDVTKLRDELNNWIDVLRSIQ